MASASLSTSATALRGALSSPTLRAIVIRNFSPLLRRALHSMPGGAATATTTSTSTSSSSSSPHTPSARIHQRSSRLFSVTPLLADAGASPHERSHNERRIVPFSAEAVYSVVADISKYEKFVPWCTKSQVIERVAQKNNKIIADLSVGFKVLSETYTSVVTLHPTSCIKVDVPTSSLFEYLINDWYFENTPAKPGCSLLTFQLRFAFKNPLYQHVTDVFFEDVVKQMVSAFEKRCHVLYTPAEVRAIHSSPNGKRPRSADTMHRW